MMVPNNNYRVWTVGLLVTTVAVFMGVAANELISDVKYGRSLNNAGPRANDTLKFLAVVSRNGNRGGIHDYENDPYPLDSLYWPYGSMKLSPYGRVQMYKLGARVRALYDGFLNSTYDPDDLTASSTYTDLTLMSGQAFLAGLFPPHGWQLWNTSIPWQPIPLYSDSPDNTPFVNRCEGYVLDVYDYLRYYLRVDEKRIKGLLEAYSTVTAKNITDPLYLFILWDKLMSEETEGYEIPAWTAALYPKALSFPINAVYEITFAGTEKIRRLLIGNLIGQLSETLSSKANGNTSPPMKLRYYSGHHSSIVALQHVLGVQDSSIVRVVKPGSSLLLELHEHPTTKHYSVQLLYVDGGSKDLAVTHLPLTDCGEPCELSALLNNTAKYTNVDFTKECTVEKHYLNIATKIIKYLSRFI